jgi:TPR repeat protein
MTPWEQHLAANPDFAVFCEAEDAEDRGDLRRATRLFKKSAEMGCVPAFARLGTIYDDIAPTPQPDLAVHWYKRGVRRGSWVAAQNLAVHYKMRGNRRWYVHWLTRAVEMGDEDSRDELESLS